MLILKTSLLVYIPIVYLVKNSENVINSPDIDSAKIYPNLHKNDEEQWLS